MSSKHERFAFRLSHILAKLNAGVRLDVHQLAEEFQVDKRTIQRDLNERLEFLTWKECGPRFYSIDKIRLGHLTKEDIERFARFCSIQDLLPEIDQRFYQKHLTQSVQIKGVQYEDISHLQAEFKTLEAAIEQHHYIEFYYVKSGQKKGDYYRVEPYVLINKIGVWYLIGVHNGKQKTFCFTQMSAIRQMKEHFEFSPSLKDIILGGDSIYSGNQISEVVIQVSPYAASYFTRRDLLPNQSLIKELEDGGLLLSSRHVNEMEILPIVQYWIPHLTIINPGELQERLISKLKTYYQGN